MVERSDRAPLLDWEEVPSAEKAPASPWSPPDGRVSSGCSGFGWSSGPGGPARGADGCGAPPATSGAPAAAHEAQPPGNERHLSESGGGEAPPEERVAEWEEKDQIVSVFVVTFNTRTGESTINESGRCFAGLK